MFGFRKRILVVDDEPGIAANLQALLEASGYRVEVAANGVEAMEMARRLKPHLMLLDVKLPMLSGLDVCRALKQDRSTRSIRIIMLTALGMLSDVERAVQCGADDYLHKPVEPAKVLEKVKQHL